MEGVGSYIYIILRPRAYIIIYICVMFAYLQNGNLGVQVCSDIMTWNKSVHRNAIGLFGSQAF